MKVKVLVAEDDLDVHKVVSDILHINFKDVQIEWALDGEALRLKIRQAHPPYDLILLDQDQPDDSEKDLLEIIQEEFPQVLNRVATLGCKQSDVNVPCLAKPFSLDDFGQIVKKICVV